MNNEDNNEKTNDNDNNFSTVLILRKEFEQ